MARVPIDPAPRSPNSAYKVRIECRVTATVWGRGTLSKFLGNFVRRDFVGWRNSTGVSKLFELRVSLGPLLRGICTDTFRPRLNIDLSFDPRRLVILDQATLFLR